MAKKRVAEKNKSLLQRTLPFLKGLSESKDLTVVIFIICIIAIIIVPLPSALLDFFLVISIAISVLIILISLYTEKPTDFAAFPTLLLIVTLFRLALNVATTRMILSEGHNGPEAVSEIVASFGQFVVGGNYVIGVIVFLILVIINFMVITNGSTRVAEVAARFTLDAMPGKQMAIDADMNTGAIDEDEAKRRREALAQEADFYGSMDGASKFVKGDAVAGIIITFINIIGGFLIGMFQRDMSAGDAAATFTILTIGDGLVSQLPALIVSTATGIIVTRSSKTDETSNFAESIINQLMGESRILIIVGSILMLFAMVPGLPTLSLGFVGAIFLLMAYLINRQDEGGLFAMFERWINKKAGDPNATPTQSRRRRQPTTSASAGVAGGVAASGGLATDGATKQNIPQKTEEEILSEALKVELLEVYLGFNLIRLANPKYGGSLLERIKMQRKNLASEYGFLMPVVRVRDSVDLDADQYQIRLKGVVVSTAQVFPDKFLAFESGIAHNKIEGIPTKEPAFGLDALWIEPSLKDEALLNSYTVIDAVTVISTHIVEVVKQNAEDLITRQDVLKLMDNLAQSFPVVVEDAKKVATLGTIQQILKALLHEQIPIRDMLTILETITDAAAVANGDINYIIDRVRQALSRVISDTFKDDNGKLQLITLSPESEQYLLNKQNDGSGRMRPIVLNVSETNALIESVRAEVERVRQFAVASPVILVSQQLRRYLSEKLEQFSVKVVVLSHAEIDSRSPFEICGQITIPFGN
ncbi:flagellar biosynthesis protein FlhA [Helicobacter monodelphidis]|uniref:flagellar biosynthesis protein FlhA n=1 Tax=Helicobacter sp. 15-1451 TaxID=2004995 RepID=UPI000DCCD4BF|nr:flagellar biosynthesis protein FlhA [Helicobacter sp. 15-1451]RAX57359.1 flagellar biosynthesis protein FlhA [Helicobacter sp. 15-1451]